jgi:hypothetical protein
MKARTAAMLSVPAILGMQRLLANDIFLRPTSTGPSSPVLQRSRQLKTPAP